MKSITLEKEKEIIDNRIKVPVLLLAAMLWFLIWAGYNTYPQLLNLSDFPGNFLNLFHGLRAFFPLLAAYLATIFLLMRQPISLRVFQGPLALLFVYNLIGIISSIFLSGKPLIALYWALQYGTVLMVLWVISVHSKSLFSITRLINFNWFLVAIILFSFLILYLIQPGIISSIIKGNFWGERPYGELAGEGKTIMGMAITRPTGLGRYAAVAAIIAFARLLYSKRRSKFIWFLLFLLFLFILIFSQARTAILAFLAGVLLILWLKSRSKFLLIFGISFVLFLLGLIGFYQVFWNYLTLGKMVFDPILSGRIATWQEGWQLFLTSPLLGYGFHADRIFFEAGQHAHNAILHALVQTGLVGTTFFISAFIAAWIILFRLLKQPRFQKTEKPCLIEIAGVLAFFTVRSITESTGAFFGADWILLAPLLAYITILNQRNFYSKSVKEQYIKKKEVA